MIIEDEVHCFVEIEIPQKYAKIIHKVNCKLGFIRQMHKNGVFKILFTELIENNDDKRILSDKE